MGALVGRSGAAWLSAVILTGCLGFYWSPALMFFFETCCAAGNSNEPPAVDLSRTEWDFGSVTAGPTLQASFPLRNHGGERLIVQQIESSCQCASSRHPTTIVERGDTSNLVVTLDTAQLAGPLKLEIKYQTNDPRHPTLSLALLADVQDEK